MGTPKLVSDFYERLWRCAEQAALRELLHDDVSFRGSLGAELRGPDAFWGYLVGVRSALADYRCDILDCVAEGDAAFARMRFSGVHVGPFRGFAATGKPVEWAGAAHFSFRDGKIVRIWVLGDLAGLDALLRRNEKES